MLRYLKYIFLTFAMLAMGVGSFFFFNNKHDVLTAMDHRERLGHDYIVGNCPKADDNYYFPCFYNELESYMGKVGLTGVSVGLKFAFNFIDEDKESTSRFANEKIKSLYYSLNFLKLNNLALRHSNKRYFGFDFVYAGYISKLEDYYKTAYEFSENMIAGIRGKDGIVIITDVHEREVATLEFERLVKEYNELKQETSEFTQSEITRLTDRNREKSDIQ